MRIAVVSTVYKQTPPIGYGGIERVVSTYVEELVRRGHDVTLFATPGSHCSGLTVEIPEYDSSVAPTGINSQADHRSEEGLYRRMKAHLDQHPVDLIHDWSFDQLFVRRHPERFPFLVSSCIPLPQGHATPNLVLSSKVHAESAGVGLPYVHYGLDLSQWTPCYTKSDTLVHIAKIARYKAQHVAILAAFRAKAKLRIAGNVEDALYDRLAIRPLTRLLPGMKRIGELASTADELRQARALVQTPRWLDVFPLVSLEAMACGTPIVALNRGGLCEQIVPGENGFLADDLPSLVEAIRRLDEIEPRRCRAYAEDRFTVARMVTDYEQLMIRVRDGDRW